MPAKLEEVVMDADARNLEKVAPGVEKLFFNRISGHGLLGSNSLASVVRGRQRAAIDLAAGRER